MTTYMYLCLSSVFLNDHFFKGEQNLHHQILKQDGQTGDDPTLLRMYLPVLTLVKNFNVCTERGEGEREREGGRERES